MSHDAGEVSWQTLRRIVRDWSGADAELEQVRTLDGGSISTTLLLTTKAGQRAVLKISPHRVDRAYLREAEQLRLLRTLGLPAPQVIDCHVGTLESPDSYLLLEHMPGMNLHDAREECSLEQFDRLQEHLAEIVLALHAHTANGYGRAGAQASASTDAPLDSRRAHGDGVTQPPEGQIDSWPVFFRQMYDAIWQECLRRAVLPHRARKVIARIHDRLETLLQHEDRPRLTHGDLWTSNILAAPDENGNWRVTALLDPNCKYAHAECELAYLELFHTTTPAFSRHYQRVFRLTDSYHRLRKHVYQLYELINHVNLFGERYLKPMQATLEKLAPAV
ncbi:MAG: fructosamine kinase family protein [Phycisphaerae bacterium]|nr:fructosamine kinase family protein [Phycisphaerae bacterium]MDW8262899.1 fructosamine kinase family protein [Phycisphaerales bacterium]